MKYLKKNIYLITMLLATIIIISCLYIQNGLFKNEDNIIEEDNLIVEKEITEDIKPEICTVDIKGEVLKPGVYQTDCTKKINEIITLAGGLTDNADTSQINLAKTIKDEMVIVIYSKDTLKEECICKNDDTIKSTLNEEIDITTNKLININIATLEELKEIPGIGESKASAIINYRLNNGPFQNLEELINIKGIGEKLYEQIKVYLTT